MDKTPGQIAYESEIAQRPFYPDGASRPSGEQLRPIAKWSWERP
jgi:hypothetical protein